MPNMRQRAFSGFLKITDRRIAGVGAPLSRNSATGIADGDSSGDYRPL